MRCYICAKLSWQILCKRCKKELFATTISRRTVGTLEVISFYPYDTIEPLLLTKHTPEGYRIYKALSQITMKPFIKTFCKSDKKDIYIIGIDEDIKSGYSHVALLTHAMKSKHTIPLYGRLMARNRVTYAGKDLQFRLEHPRDFLYTGKQGIDVILVDDIITTGITLQEAHKTLISYDVNVLFALTLADADKS